MTRPLERALILQVLGDVDVMFAGIDNATGDIILAGQTIVGLADGVDTVSSCGIADIPNWNGGAFWLLAIPPFASTLRARSSPQSRFRRAKRCAR